MWAKNYWPQNYWPQNYWPTFGAGTPTPPVVTEEFTVGGSYVTNVFDNHGVSTPQSWGLMKRTN